MLSNLRVYQKLAFGFAAVTATMLIMAIVIGLTLQAASRASDANNDSNVAETALNRVTEQIYRGDRAVLAFALSGDPRYDVAAKDAMASIDPCFVLALKNLPADRADLLAKVTAARQAAGKWLDVVSMPRIKYMQMPNSRERIEASWPAGADLTTDTLHAVQDAQQIVTTWSKQETVNENAEMSRLMLTLIIGTSLCFVLSILAGWIITRSITRPLSGMITVMGTLAAGDVSVEIPALARRDEVGDVGRAVQVFKDAAIEKLRLVAQGEQARAVAEQERADVEEHRRRKAAEQHQVVTELAAGLSRLAAGDLTNDLQSEFAPEYEQLRSDFNRAVSELRNLVGNIANNTSAISAGTEEITKASDDLSRRTEQQAASLEETAAALDQIIGVIDEIAFQTNLLALNAGVEAARAGDAGRGFAVVASEVRALAQRSADAAKEIKGLVLASEDHVKQGVKLVSATGEALTRIVTQVGEITTIISDIAGAAQEQSIGLTQVNTAINQMDQVTQQNAAMVEESTAAAHNLAQETTGLVTLIRRFDISEPGAERRPPAAKPPAPKARRGLKVVSATAAKTWEEF